MRRLSGTARAGHSRNSPRRSSAAEQTSAVFASHVSYDQNSHRFLDSSAMTRSVIGTERERETPEKSKRTRKIAGERLGQLADLNGPTSQNPFSHFLYPERTKCPCCYYDRPTAAYLCCSHHSRIRSPWRAVAEAPRLNAITLNRTHRTLIHIPAIAIVVDLLLLCGAHTATSSFFLV